MVCERWSASRRAAPLRRIPSRDTPRAVVFVGAVEGGFVLSLTRRSPEPLLAAGRVLAPLVASALSAAPAMCP